MERQGINRNNMRHVVSVVVYSVARAPTQAVTQFNGYFGCNWCLQKGERPGGAKKYPVQEVEPKEQTEVQMINDMEAVNPWPTFICTL